MSEKNKNLGYDPDILEQELNSMVDPEVDLASDISGMLPNNEIQQPTNNEELVAILEKEGYTISLKGKILTSQERANINHWGINNENEYLLKTLEGFVSTTLPDAFAANNSFHQLMITARAFRDGEDWSTLLDSLPEGQLKVITNEIAKYAEIKKGTILNSHINLKVIPLTPNEFQPIETTNSTAGGEIDNDVEFADDLPLYLYIQYWLEGQYIKNNHKELRSMVIDDVVTKGTGIVSITYNERVASGLKMNNNKGDVVLEYIDPIQFYPDPKARKQDLSDMDYCYIASMKSIVELMQHDNWNDIKETFFSKEYNDINGGYDQQTQIYKEIINKYRNISTDREPIMYWILYRKVWVDSLKTYKVLMSEFIGDNAEVQLCANKPTNMDELPFAVFKAQKNSPDFFSKSPLMQMLTTQSMINYLQSLVANAVMNSVNPLLIASADTGLSSESLAILSTAPGASAIVDTSEVNQTIRWMEKPVPNGVLEILNHFDGKTQLGSGVNKLKQGDSGSVQTSQAMQILANQGELADLELLNNYGSFVVNLSKIMTKVMIANYDERVVQLAELDPNSESEFLYVNYDPSMLAGLNVDFVIDGEVLSDTQYRERQAIMKNLYIEQKQMGFEVDLISPEEFIDESTLPNKQAARLRLSQMRESLLSAKADLILKHINNYATVWTLVDNIYSAVGNGSGNFIPPMTPISALPENLQGEIPAQVQQMLIDYPEYGMTMDAKFAPFYLNQDIFKKYIIQLFKITTKAQVEQEAQALIPTGANQTLQQTQQQAQQQNMQLQQEQGGAPMDEEPNRASGANATQPAQENVKMGNAYDA